MTIVIALLACWSSPKSTSPDSVADSAVCDATGDDAALREQLLEAYCAWDVPCLDIYGGDMQACLDFIRPLVECAHEAPCAQQACTDALLAMPPCGQENYPEVCERALVPESPCGD
ncbi:MAG: hypothetical protein H6740_26400 [Alphaproteobacteria bacterium]|nr:hypothetical protein [Alphaproteobacteria bacterium]